MKWSALVAIDVFLSMLIFVICIFLSLQLGEFQVGMAISVLGLSANMFDIILAFHLREPSLTEDMAKALCKVFASGIRRKIIKILLLKSDLLFDQMLQEFSNLNMSIEPSSLHRHLLDLQKIIHNHKEVLNTGIHVSRYRIDEKYEKFFRKHFEIL